MEKELRDAWAAFVQAAAKAEAIGLHIALPFNPTGTLAVSQTGKFVAPASPVKQETMPKKSI